jgi:hypothetical protein
VVTITAAYKKHLSLQQNNINDYTMETDLFKMLFSAQGLGVAQTILLIALLWFSLFRKGEIKELRRDMNDLRKDMDANSALLRKDMEGLSTELKGDMALLRSDMEGNMALLRSDMEGNMALLRRDMKDLRSELKTENTALWREIKSIKSNDLHHIKKALLLQAEDAVKNKERYERIKDMLDDNNEDETA